jgi:transmembrane sensor
MLAGTMDQVAVIDGRVRVQKTLLAAGQGASILAPGQVSAPVAVDTTEATAWRQRRLIFRSHSLADVAAEFNRYNREPKIRVIDEAVRARTFNGVFDADNPDAFLRFLEETNGISVQRGLKEVTVRAR